MYEAPNPILSPSAPLLTLMERMRLQSNFDALPNPNVVEDVVIAVLDVMDGRLTPMETHLLREVADLGRIIQQAKSEIAAIRLDAITHSHIPSATDELGAIVEHTATATNNILESCEALDKLAGTLGKNQADILRDATTQIYEACSFQDITGQRIVKVVKALQAIEMKVQELSSGTPAHPITPGTDVSASSAGQRAPTLLNGPALPHEAMGQDDIDKLLADFD